MKIGVLGSRGYIGSQLFTELSSHFRNQVVGISKLEFESPQIRKVKYDYLIHSANPARRLRAENNPTTDFIETVEKLDKILNGFQFSNLLLISSLSCRTQPDTTYGKHRLLCEKIVSLSGGAVVRLGPMYGGHRERTTLDDIVEGKPVFFSQDTKYSYTNVAWNASYIAQNLHNFRGISEVGASNFITLQEIAEKLKSKSKFGTVNDDQIIENCAYGPDSREVVNFLLESS